MSAYAETVARMYALAPRGIRLELDRMRAALRMRGNPERGLRVVHVAGTNGKGSVAATTASVLRAAGYKVGLYTSPHLHRFVERIRVDGRPMSEAALVRGYRDLVRTLEKPSAPRLTFFEVATLLAFERFRDAACDVVVLEVGLGGRLDATNVIARPEVTVITNIARDHEAYLGDTITEIALEKAGIIKRGVPLIAGSRDREARASIQAIAKRRRAPAWWIDERFGWSEGARGVSVWVDATRVDGLRPALEGTHQKDNLACAVAACVSLRASGFEISTQAIRKGIRTTRWPGRLEHISGKPAWIFDAAHNPDGCAALARHLRALPKAGRKVLLFGAMHDKAHAAMLAPLMPCVDDVLFTRPSTPRAADPDPLARAFGGASISSVHGAIRAAKRRAGKGGLVICAGSIYLLAEARAEVLGVRTEPIITL